MIIIYKKKEISDEKLMMLFKMLSDQTRLLILDSLKGGSKTVNSIVSQLKLSQPLISHHLKVLKKYGLVVSCKKSGFIYYALSTPTIVDLLNNVSDVEKHINVLSKKVNNDNFFEYYPVCCTNNSCKCNTKIKKLKN